MGPAGRGTLAALPLLATSVRSYQPCQLLHISSCTAPALSAHDGVAGYTEPTTPQPVQCSFASAWVADGPRTPGSATPTAAPASSAPPPAPPHAGPCAPAARGPTATPQECVRWRRDSCGIDKQRTLMQDQRAIACLFGCTTSATRRHVHQTRQHAHLWFRTIRAKRAALCVCAHVRVRGCQARREQAQEAQRPRQPCTPCSWPDQDARCLCGFERSPLPGAAVHAEQQACTAR